MRIAALVANAIPAHLAGAERALHETLEWLSTRGHECCVYARNGAHVPLDVDGVRVVGQRKAGSATELLRASDVVFTQLEDSMTAQLLAFETQTPLVFYAHSPNQLERLGLIPEACSLVLFNSQHVADAAAWWPGESMILHPPVFAERYRVEPNGQAVTLIGLSHRKGAMQFLRAARDLPSIRFLGVQGAYDTQVIDAGGLIEFGKGGDTDHSVKTGNMAGMPENMTCGPPIPDMRPVYANTRVLLVLSEHESWGRVANEAMVSGIPVIAHPTPGLVECIGDTAWTVQRDNARELAETIRRLVEDQAEWDIWSAHALQRAADLDPLPQLLDLEARLLRIVAAKPAVSLG